MKKYNEKLNSNNIDTIIHNVCSECWIKAMKASYDNKWNKDEIISTYHLWICDFCKKKKGITETRDFWYPDFNLI